MTKYKILVVDDEESLCEILQFNLEVEGYEVDVAYSAEQALDMHPERYSLILLDVMMGETSGFKMARQLKSRPETAGVPIIFCTARDTEDDTVAGLNIGADDYIAKPFRPRELVSRIRSVLRRYGKEKTLVPLGGVMVDTEKGRVTRDGRDVYLSALEYRLLMTLANHAGQVLSRNQLLESIWDVSGDFVNDNTLTVYIKRLREKIEDTPSDPKLLQTVWGVGYRLHTV